MMRIFKEAFILCLICLVASFVLAGIYSLVKPQILAQSKKEKELESGLKGVLPEVEYFKEVKKDSLTYYEGYYQDKLKGFAFYLETKGYSSSIKMVVGLDLGKRITAVKIIEQNETPGLGTRIKEEAFLSQFARKGLEDLGGVSTISGATISSKAVIEAIKRDLERFKGLLP